MESVSVASSDGFDYNAEKGGVDVMDGMVSYCTVRRATLRWPVRLFMTMIDVGALAGFVLYNALFETVTRGNRDRFFFLLNVSEELMKMCMSYRRLHKNIPETARSIALNERQTSVQKQTSRERAPKRGRSQL